MMLGRIPVRIPAPHPMVRHASAGHSARMATPPNKNHPSPPTPATADAPADRLILQGIHVDLTPALKSAIVGKLAPLLRHEERTVRMHVRLHRDQKLGGENHYTLTAQMEVPGPDVIAHASGTDAYGIIDVLAEKLDHLLERRHDRRKDKRNHPHAVEIPADLPKV